MGIATGLAIAGLATNVVSQVAAAKSASGAAKKAAAQQVDASREGQRYLDDGYKPYVNAGRQVASTLGRLTTPGPGARYAAADPTMDRPPAPPRAVPRQGPPDGGNRPRGALASMGPQGPQGRPPMGPQGPQGPQGPSRGMPPGMVMLEANDGSGARPVPEQQAERFLATGNFRRVE